MQRNLLKMLTKLVNIYDFDKTIYDGDCTLDFYLFCVKRQPILLLFILRPLVFFALFMVRLKSREDFKESFYRSFLPHIDAYNLVKEFWNVRINRIKEFYNIKKSPTDIIITASPRFIVDEAAKRVNFRLIASEVDAQTGKLLSPNCRGSNKVIRLKESSYLGRNDVINNFYTDSYSDSYLAELAVKSYLVKGDDIITFNTKTKKNTLFKSLDFVRFILVGGINVISGVFFASLASLFMQPNVAFIVGYVCSLVTGYFLMSAVVFDNRLFSFMQFIKYCLGYIPNFLIQNLTIVIIYNYLGINHLIAYCIAAIVAVPATYIIMKLGVFKK